MFFDKDQNVWMCILVISVAIEEYCIDNTE